MRRFQPPLTLTKVQRPIRAQLRIVQGKQVANAYGVLAQPTAANPNPPQFARRWTFYIGPDGIIQEIDKTPGTQNAGQNVIAKLQALGVKEKK